MPWSSRFRREANLRDNTNIMKLRCDTKLWHFWSFKAKLEHKCVLIGINGGLVNLNHNVFGGQFTTKKPMKLGDIKWKHFWCFKFLYYLYHVFKRFCYTYMWYFLITFRIRNIFYPDSYIRWTMLTAFILINHTKWWTKYT